MGSGQAQRRVRANKNALAPALREGGEGRKGGRLSGYIFIPLYCTENLAAWYCTVQYAVAGDEDSTNTYCTVLYSTLYRTVARTVRLPR